MAVIPAFERLQQEDQKFGISLGYLETLSEKKNRSWRRDCFEFVTDFRHQQEERQED